MVLLGFLLVFLHLLHSALLSKQMLVEDLLAFFPWEYINRFDLCSRIWFCIFVFVNLQFFQTQFVFVGFFMRGKSILSFTRELGPLGIGRYDAASNKAVQSLCVGDG